jgi:4-aminobutyrate aminotransferase
LSSRKFAKIVVNPPGPNARRVIETETEYFTFSHDRLYPLFAKKAKGSIVEDLDGNTFIDFSQGSGSVSIGIGNEKQVRAMQEELERGTVTGFPYSHESTVQLSKRIAELTPGKFKKRVAFGTSGEEANEGAFKLARWHTRRPQFLSFFGAHHGFLGFTTALDGHYSAQVRGFHPLTPGVVHVPYPYCYRCPWGKTFPDCGYACLDWIENMVMNTIAPPENLAGIFVEPYQGPGGMVPAPKDFHPRLKRICERHGIMFIDDEILTGLGRTGKMFGIDHYEGVVPDIMVLGKGLSNSSFPISAFVSSQEIMDWEPGAHTTTYHGHPLGAVAALTVLDVIKEKGLVERSRIVGERAKKRFQELQERHELIGDVRGTGLFIGVEFVKDRNTKEPATKETMLLAYSAFRKGLILQWNGLKFNVVKIYPSLQIEEEVLNEGIDIFEEALYDVEKGRVELPSDLPPQYLIKTSYR